jgi:hypothetical protein
VAARTYGYYIIAGASNDEDIHMAGTQVTTGIDGRYLLSEVPACTYDISVRGKKWLRQINAGVRGSKKIRLLWTIF